MCVALFLDEGIKFKKKIIREMQYVVDTGCDLLFLFATRDTVIVVVYSLFIYTSVLLGTLL